MAVTEHPLADSQHQRSVTVHQIGERRFTVMKRRSPIWCTVTERWCWESASGGSVTAIKRKTLFRRLSWSWCVKQESWIEAVPWAIGCTRLLTGRPPRRGWSPLEDARVKGKRCTQPPSRSRLKTKHGTSYVRSWMKN